LGIILFFKHLSQLPQPFFVMYFYSIFDNRQIGFDSFSGFISLLVSPCTAQHSTAQHSTAQHSTAQHSTAQHSTAQHSTAQHSTAQHKSTDRFRLTLTRSVFSNRDRKSSHLASPRNEASRLRSGTFFSIRQRNPKTIGLITNERAD
jgi:hypothetical protein